MQHHFAILALASLCALLPACGSDPGPVAPSSPANGGQTANTPGAGASAGSSKGGSGSNSGTTGGTSGTDPINQTCANGVAGFCHCVEWSGDTPCTNTELSQFYTLCQEGTDEGLFKCSASYVSGNTVDCSGLANGCL